MRLAELYFFRRFPPVKTEFQVTVYESNYYLHKVFTALNLPPKASNFTSSASIEPRELCKPFLCLPGLFLMCSLPGSTHEKN